MCKLLSDALPLLPYIFCNFLNLFFKSSQVTRSFYVADIHQETVFLSKEGTLASLKAYWKWESTVLHLHWGKKWWVQAVSQGKFQLASRKTLLTVTQSSSRLSGGATSLEIDKNRSVMLFQNRLSWTWQTWCTREPPCLCSPGCAVRSWFHPKLWIFSRRNTIDPGLSADPLECVTFF